MTTSSISSTQNGTSNSPPTQAHITASTYVPNANGALPSTTSNNNNRLLFNRLANERKTVHVMSANLNKDVSKRDRQLINSYNHAAAAANGGAPGGTAGASGLNTTTGTTNLTNAHNYQNNFLNNQSTLDYNGMMATGRSHTNASTFLQKLSSKFTRR